MKLTIDVTCEPHEQRRVGERLFAGSGTAGGHVRSRIRLASSKRRRETAEEELVPGVLCPGCGCGRVAGLEWGKRKTSRPS